MATRQREVKVVDSNTMEPEITKLGNRIKRLITKTKDGSEKITFSTMTIVGGVDIFESFDSDTVFYMVEGNCTIEWDGKSVELTDGMAIYIPLGTKFRYCAAKDHQLISVFSPAIV